MVETAFYELDGRRLETAWHAGTRPALVPWVLLHEGLGSVAMWRDFPAALVARTGRSAFVVSRYGHGRSTRLAQARDVDYMHREATDVLPALLAAAGIARAILFGHSDGGSIALIAAATHPMLVAGLVLEAPHVIVEDVSVSSIAAARERWHVTDFPARFARYHDDAAATFFGWNDIWLDPRFRNWDITALLPAIVAPTLVVQGTADEYGSAAQTALIARGVTGAQVVMLEGCGHAPHRERTDEVLALCATFSEQLAGKRAPGETFRGESR